MTTEEAVQYLKAHCNGHRYFDEALQVLIQAAKRTQRLERALEVAERVYNKFGKDSDWTEWRDLGEALREIEEARK